jgi:flagellar basal body-associated protein FliL
MKDVEESTEHEAPKGPKTPKLVLIFLALNLAATGFVAFKVLTAPAPAAAAAAKPVVAEPDKPGPLKNLEAFVVNLNDIKDPRFLKTTMDIEVRGPKVLALFDETKVRIVRDDVMSYLSGLTLADIMGEEGKTKVKRDVLARLQKHFSEGDIRRVLLAEFVIQ